MLRNQVLILLGVGLLATSTARADDVGFVDCHDHSENIQVLGKAAKTSQVMASLPCGERFTILLYGVVFSRIQTRDGQVGYIHSYLISRDYSATSVQPSAVKAPAQTQPATAVGSAAQEYHAQSVPPTPRKVYNVPKAPIVPTRTADGLSLQECESLGASLNKTLAGPGADEMWKRLANDTEVVALKTLLNCGKLAANARDFELSSGLYELALRAGIARGAQLEADNTTLINAYNQLLTQATEYAASVQEYVARVQNWVAAQQTQPSSVQPPLTRWQRFKQGLAAYAEAQAEYQRQHPTVHCTAQTYGNQTEMTCR